MPFRLNSQQKAAVAYARGPLLIVAGAGTGKTTVITERVKYLLQKKKARPEEILALTFTEKAAGEMLERLDVVMPLGYQEPWVSTFHAFCDRILREEGLEIGLSPDYKILSQPEQWFLLKKHLFEFKLSYYRPLGNPTKFIGALLKFFSRLQDEDVTPAELENYKKEEKENFKKYQELFRAFEFYQKLKLKENVLDFGDLISWTLKLFRERPKILKKYQQKFKHILVDEFQDTNFAQLQLIKLLAPAKNNPNLAVTGDDDQAVYAFRGTSVFNILNFKKYYPKAKEVVLINNYRSGQKLLDKAYQLIQYNNPDRLEKKLKVDKKLVSQRKKKLPDPEAVTVDTLEAEADSVAAKILELTAKKAYTYKDFAVLARANNHLEPFIAAFKHYQIPYQLVGNRGLFDQEEIKDLLFFLQVVIDLGDTPNLFQLLHADVFKVEPEQLLNMLQQAKKERKSLWKMVESTSPSHRGLHLLVEQVKAARQRAVKESASPILYEFIQKTGYIKTLIKEESLENQLKINNLNLFFNHLKRFEAEQENNLLVDFVEYVSLMIEAGENPAQAEIEDIDTVRLLTVHSAKGLEFPIVFVVNLVADRFPSRRRRDPIEIPEEIIKETLPKGDYHLQEERRLFYVAVTRTKDRLYLLAGQDYGGARKKKPSGLIKELGIELKGEEKKESRRLLWLEIPKGEIFKPKKIIKGKLKLDYFSYSQIDVFKTCPLKYKYRYILQVPVKPHHALTFGQSIHNTLRDFHRFEQKDQKPDKETLFFLYQQNFLPLGYQSEKHKQIRFKSGKKALLKYFKKGRDQFVGKPYLLEKSFRIKIANTWLIGKIDRIDLINKDTYELIDYKTGSTKNQKDVDKDVQLTIYKMAAQQALNIDVQELALYFIEENKKMTTKRQLEQIEKKKEEIAKTIADIHISKFKPKPGYPFPCSYCEYSQICPFAKRS